MEGAIAELISVGVLEEHSKYGLNRGTCNPRQYSRCQNPEIYSNWTWSLFVIVQVGEIFCIEGVAGCCEVNALVVSKEMIARMFSQPERQDSKLQLCVICDGEEVVGGCAVDS